jgi:hypothetical protein
MFLVAVCAMSCATPIIVAERPDGGGDPASLPSLLPPDAAEEGLSGPDIDASGDTGPIWSQGAPDADASDD